MVLSKTVWAFVFGLLLGGFVGMNSAKGASWHDRRTTIVVDPSSPRKAIVRDRDGVKQGTIETELNGKAVVKDRFGRKVDKLRVPR